MRSEKTKIRTKKLPKVAIAFGIIFMALVQLLPFYITITTALKPKTDLSSQWVFPIKEFTGENFVTAIQDGNVLRAILNTAFITGTSTVLVIILATLAAYPLARWTSRFNFGMLNFFIGLMMIPPLSVLVPLYSMLRDFGAINTYWGMILVMVAGNLPVATFLYTSFMRSLPISIEEAATIDGAKPLSILFKIIVPMLKPVTATVIILASVGMWNEFALSGFILRDPSKQIIAPTIASFFGSSSSNMGAAAAASLLSVVPVLLVYLGLQKYFIKGMVAGAEK